MRVKCWWLVSCLIDYYFTENAISINIVEVPFLAHKIPIEKQLFPLQIDPIIRLLEQHDIHDELLHSGRCFIHRATGDPWKLVFIMWP